MKRPLLAALALAIGATLFAVSSAPAGTPALRAEPIVCQPCGDDDGKKLAALAAKVAKLKKEMRLLEARMAREPASEPSLRARHARRLSEVKKGLQDLEKHIRALKAGSAARSKASRKKARATVERTKTYTLSTTTAPATRRYRSDVRVVKQSPKRTTVTVRSVKPGDGARCDCACHKKKTPPQTATRARAATPFDQAARKIKAHVAQLVKEKAVLEKKIRDVHARLAQAKRALMDLKRKHELQARRAQAEVRRQAAARNRARIRAQTTLRAPVRSRALAPRGAIRRGVAPDHGANVLVELQHIRRDVNKIARLLEKALIMIHKAHPSESSPKAKAKARAKESGAKAKRKKPKKQDLRTL